MGLQLDLRLVERLFFLVGVERIVQSSGTGLGLRVCKSLCEAMHCEVRFFGCFSVW
jgi:signal transduction histidine kinase